MKRRVQFTIGPGSSPAFAGVRPGSKSALFHHLIDVGSADQTGLRSVFENRPPDPAVELFDPGELPAIIDFVMKGGLEEAQRKDLARQREGATEVSCSAFGRAVVERM